MKLKNGRLETRHILLVALAYLIFSVYAIHVNGVGTNAPVMMTYYQINAAKQGFFITMQAIGSLSALIYIALYGERYNKINAFAFGFFVSGVSLILAGFAPHYIVLIFLFMLCGAGFSSADTMMNGAIPELFPKYKNTLLPLLHAFFGVGAMIAPIFFTIIVNPDIPKTFSIPFLVIGSLLAFFVIVFFIITRRLIPETPYADMSTNRKRVSDNPAEIFKSAKAWLFIISGICYFSFYIGLMSWLPTYCQTIGMDFNLSGVVLTMFFTGNLVMRFCGPLFLKKITPRKAFIIFTLVSAVLAASAIILSPFLADNPAIMMILLVACGFMQGSNVAFLVLMCTATFPERIASASSLTFISASIAAMTAPLWMGALAELTGFFIPLLMVCILLAVSVVPVILIK